MGRTVLLRHELPDGTVHFDWMIERPDGTGLITFRVAERIDHDGVREFGAERLPDHRAAYLDYEGQVSGGRGSVRRVASGVLAIGRDAAEEFACEGELGGRRVKFLGRIAGGSWRFRVEDLA